uniref:Minus-C odorant binding protein 2 n=1 Tax=Batocera horsfieldi TaxID=351105 RepID=D4P5A8_9CUCU|nr:minus-C odorant binding protein 2 [Batocera horsfieldi]
MDSLIFLVVVSSLLAMSTVQAALERSEYSPKLLELVDSLHSICIGKSGTDEDSINKVINGEFTDEPKIKKYMKCGITEVGVMNEEGVIDYEMTAELLPVKLVDKSIAIIKKCEADGKDIPNLDDRVFALFKCYHDQDPETFIFF